MPFSRIRANAEANGVFCYKMSLIGEKNVSDTISKIALELRSANALIQERRKSRKCVTRWSIYTLLLVLGTPLAFCAFNTIYANFTLLTWIRNDFDEGEQIGLYLAAIILYAVEATILFLPMIFCFD